MKVRQNKDFSLPKRVGFFLYKKFVGNCHGNTLYKWVDNDHNEVNRNAIKIVMETATQIVSVWRQKLFRFRTKKCNTKGMFNMREEPSIFDVADFFLSKESMTNKKLQKLSYYAVAWMYTLREEDIAPDTQFQAWRHGPVSPELYDAFKEYGYHDIPQIEEETEVFTDGQLDILENVWYTYGDQTGNSLEALTHSEDPWRSTFKPDAENRCNAPIPLDLMKSFYSSIQAVEEEC